MSRNSPPVFAFWLLECLLPVQFRDAILGDLAEEFLLRASSSRSSARRWFWGQAFRSLPFLLWSLLRSEFAFSTGIAAVVFLSMAGLKFTADLVIRRWVAPAPLTEVVLAPIIFLSLSMLGGCLAGRIRRAAAVFLALMVATTVVVLIALNPCPIPVPWWYQFGFLTFGPMTVLLAPAILGVSETEKGSLK